MPQSNGHQPLTEGTRDRAIRYPKNERFVRAVEMIETATEVAIANIEAMRGDMRQREMLESLRNARTAITRVINSLERVA